MPVPYYEMLQRAGKTGPYAPTEHWRSGGGQGEAQSRQYDAVTGGRLTMGGSREMMDEYWQREKAAADAMRASHQSGESSAALHQSRMAQAQGAQQMRAGMAAGSPLAARAAMGGYGQQAVGIAAQGGMGRADEMNQARLAQMDTLGRRGAMEGDLQGLQDQRMQADIQRRLMEQQANEIRRAAKEGVYNDQAIGGMGMAASGMGSLATSGADQTSDKRNKSSYAYSDRRLKQSMMRGIR